jgi:membrane-associated phospholipid phosphatase
MANASRLSSSSVRHLITLHAVARIISDIFNPAVLGVPFLIVAASAAEVSGTYRFALLYFLVAVPLPFCYVLWLVATNRVTDLHLSERRQRLAPFAISLCAALCGLVLLHALAAPTILVVALSTAFVQTALLFVITLWWKISIHTAAIAGLVTFAIMVLGSNALACTPLVPLVAWARVYLHRHTLLQTVAGGAVGYLTFAMMYCTRGVIW